ncbi:MAG TPA: SCP2 sterol-binding domain-containing protein [Acidimicrobiales bacterium]|nr:SCP2 sterol-binding domain-containing protein [Acidimicrobiales bacterium]
MGEYAFLSAEWTEAARKVQAEYADRAPAPAVAMRLNLVVTEVPFGEGTVDAHLDTSAGEVVLDLGHLEEPDLTVTLDYETAKMILVEQNPQAGMQAFMAGRIRIDGDMSKLLAMQTQSVDPVAAEIMQRVRELTA